jgi:ATP-dependent Clp endopeptidase proteolytic subunit ClpP
MKTIEIDNKSGKVKLNEVVTRESIGKMIDEIGKLFGATASASGADFGEIMNAAENAVDVLEIEINSPGGSVFDGYTIYQEIQSLKDRGVVVNATITGMAASMASVICMACNKVSIVPHGRMMIHDASNTVQGNADQLRKTADLLDSISADIANIYATRTGKEVSEIRAMMKKETWMNAEATVENGFADEVLNYNKKDAKAEAFDIETQKPENNRMNILSKLFPNNDQVAQIEAQLEENDNLRNENADLQAKLETLKDLDQTVIENKVVIENLNTENETIKAQLEEAKAKIEELENAVPKAVVQELAAIGQDKAIDLTGDTESKDLYAQYRDLQKTNPRAAAQFWIDNESAIKSQ